MLLKNFAAAAEFLRTERVSRGKKVLSRSVRRVTRGFTAGLLPTVESPVAARRALCLLL
jgi:hypothetical protein